MYRHTILSYIYIYIYMCVFYAYHSVAQQCIHCCKIDQPYPMEIVKFRVIRTPKPRNQLTKNWQWVIMSVITPHVPKLKMITPLAAWQRMREIYHPRVVCSFPILFCDPKFCSRPKTKLQNFFAFASYNVNSGLLHS